MGLDMYLTKEVYIKNYDHTPKELRSSASITINDKPIMHDGQNVSHAIIEVMYWRKANHIHKWFVDNCQEGKDECQKTYVTLEQLGELLAVCRKVNEDKASAENLLPPQEGFFFGGKEVDEYYFEEITNTIEALEKEIEFMEKNNHLLCRTYYYYQSSW